MTSQHDIPVDHASSPLDELRGAIITVSGTLLGAEAATRPVTLERPPSADLGDYSTNAALTLAGLAKQSPRELAGRLGDALGDCLGDSLQGYEAAGPGFLNLHLSDDWHRRALASVLAAGEGFGAGAARPSEHILVEFVSANPTGPMHVGHARNAAYGDSLARLLAFHGHAVEREFYVNDAGSQIVKLGESIQALARGQQAPQDGYRGEYVAQLADAIAEAASAEPAQVGRAATRIVLEQITASLARFNVLPFDHWQYESELHRPDDSLRDAGGAPVSPVAHALELLQAAGHAYRSEGALWLRSTAFGDDKDRVLVRGSGEHTYFASDVAYHQRKRERGFQRQIDVWGADHHGYLQRMRAAYQALGGDSSELEMLTMQLVHLVAHGERAQMSKRAGSFVTLDELVQEIGVDAARWYLLSRSHDTTVELDLELAKRQSSENAVYYVQYAHARIASMLSRASVEDPSTLLATPPAEPLHPSERAVVKALLQLPGEVAEAAERRAPHRIAAYVLGLAQEFTAFYRDCRVVGATPDELEAQRVAICLAVHNALASCLQMLGVSAPEEM
ncbi:MAG: arginine--tRNA ligase [Solirubrobacteraceae bacterium]